MSDNRIVLAGAVIGGLLCAIILGVAGFRVERQTSSPPPTPFPFIPRAAYIPPGSIFCLPGTPGAVESPYAYESNLIPNPIADSDYILPHGIHDTVCLPGGKWDNYALLETDRINGSGILQRWELLNGPSKGARFDFLHLASVFVTGPTRAYAGVLPKSAKRLYDDTALAAPLAIWLHGFPVTATIHHGGDLIGKSGWPTDPRYGNGVAGPTNAQLCVLYNADGSGWFFRVSNGYDRPPPTPTPKPATFPVKRWNAWRTSHHKSTIQYAYHGKLTNVSRQWWHHHLNCAGVQANEQWFAKGRYERQQFVHCYAYHWPQTRGDPVKWVRR